MMDWYDYFGIGAAGQAVQQHFYTPSEIVMMNERFVQSRNHLIANAYRTPQQTKLEAAKAYLKERAAAHPEWKVGKV